MGGGGEYVALRWGGALGKSSPWSSVLLSSSELSGHRTLVATDHTRPPPQPLQVLPSVLHSWAHQKHAPEFTPLLWRGTLLLTQGPSAAPGGSVRPHQAHLHGPGPLGDFDSTPVPVQTQGGPGSSHPLGCARAHPLFMLGSQT